MEQKTWLWRRKSSEKTILISEKSDLSSGRNGQEKERALELEKLLEDLNEQLSSARAEANAKDEILTKQRKVAEEAVAGWEKAEEEAANFKLELDDIVLQKAAAEERMLTSDKALKECKQQLQIVKEQHQNFISDASKKILREQEKSRVLEDRLAEANKKLSNFNIENGNLSRILEVKEKLIEDLSEYKSQSEADFEALVARLDSSEKMNASLKYEVCVLQKELEIRNEERGFNLKSAEAAHRQHLENIKKITKLETECQRLRVMVRKRLPGPAALSKMRSEVEMLGNNNAEIRKGRSISAKGSFVGRELVMANVDDASSKSITCLFDRLCAIEEENRILKEALTRKNGELQSSHVMFARTASKLSQAETQLEELSKGQIGHDLARSSPVSYDLPLASISEGGGSEDNFSTAESWASALISELEHFKIGKPTTRSSINAGGSDISLMDDFLEMERLAIVSVDKPVESPDISSEEYSLCAVSKETESKPGLSASTGKELVPVDNHSVSSGKDNELQLSFISLEKYPIWLQDILRVILQKHLKTKRSLDCIVDEIKSALSKRDLCVKEKPADASDASNKKFQEPLHTFPDSLDKTFGNPRETSSQTFQSRLEKSIFRLIDLIEGIIQRSTTDRNEQNVVSENNGSSTSNHKSLPLAGFMANVFLWKSSEISSVLHHFITVCNDLLYQKTNLEKFLGELNSTLEWIIDHCFSFQDVSNMKETIKKHFDGHQSQNDNEFEAGIKSQSSEVNITSTCEELELGNERSSSLLSDSNGSNILMQMKDFESKLKDENKRFIDENTNMKFIKKDLEERFESESAKNELLINEIHELEENISNLQVELVKLKDSKGFLEDQFENQKLINEDLAAELTITKAELNDTRQKISSLEVELQNKNNCCQELEAACLELQLQLESVAAEETPNYDKGAGEKLIRTDWEISAASEKLAECQETILNLGKQLKALASPKDVALFDKVMSTPKTAKTNRRPLLLDQMRAEDDAKFEELNSPKTKEIICTEPQKPPAAATDNPNAGLLYGRKILLNGDTSATIASIIQQSPVNSPGKLSGSYGPSQRKGEDGVGALAIVPKKQKGRLSLLRLWSRRKKETTKKATLPKVI